MSRRTGQQRTEPTRAIEQALEFRRLLDEGLAANQKELACLHGVTSSRVSQVIGLLRLAPEIIEHLRAVPAEQLAFFSERRLRDIARMPSKAAQLKAFRELRGRVEGGGGVTGSGPKKTSPRRV